MHTTITILVATLRETFLSRASLHLENLALRQQVAVLKRERRRPWLQTLVERVIGSIRRDCLDHVIVLNERHLRQILCSYLAYYHGSRTHLALGKDTPAPRNRF